MAGVLSGGCRFQEADVPEAGTPARVAPAPSKPAPAHYLSLEAGVRCADKFCEPYKKKSGDGAPGASAAGVDANDPVLRFPALSNDIERAIVAQVHSASSRVISDAAEADSKADEKSTLWSFGVVLGPEFTKEKCGAIGAFMDTAFTDAKRINSALKSRFKRPRPGEEDPDHPKSNPSFPSGHSTTAGVRYRLLTAITGATPELEIELCKQAWFMCFERLEVNAHYPSDIAAGFVLGEMVGDEVLKEAADHPDGEAGKALAAAKEQWRGLKSK